MTCNHRANSEYEQGTVARVFLPYGRPYWLEHDLNMAQVPAVICRVIQPGSFVWCGSKGHRDLTSEDLSMRGRLDNGQVFRDLTILTILSSPSRLVQTFWVWKRLVQVDFPLLSSPSIVWVSSSIVMYKNDVGLIFFWRLQEVNTRSNERPFMLLRTHRVPPDRHRWTHP